MKIIKNPIFMFILGGIIFFSVGVYAEYIVTADKIEYSANISVKDKIDDLYTKVKPAYTGSTTVTPSTSMQTLNTNNKLLNSNIIIDAIPSTYHNLAQSTTVSPDNLLFGKTAYDSLGNLITGTAHLNCISGSFTITSLINTPSGIDIETEFSPSIFMIAYFGTPFVDIYVKDTNPNYYYEYLSTKEEMRQYLLTNNYNLNGKLNAHSWSSTQYSGKTAYYVACK